MDIEIKLHKMFRDSILKTFLIICTIVFFVEVAYGIVLWFGGDIVVSITTYIFIRIILPSLLNFGVTLITYFINNNENASAELKDVCVLFNSFSLAMIILFFHSYFTTIISIIILPLICAILLCNKFLYFITSVCVSLGAILHLYLLSTDFMNAPGYYYLLNYMVILIVIFAVYFIGRSYMTSLKEVFIINDKEKQDIIKENWNVIHDENSNLYNYIAFRAKFKELVNELKNNNKKSLAIAMLEIDEIKSIIQNNGKDVVESMTLAFNRILENKVDEKTYIAKFDENTYSILFVDYSINDLVNKINEIKENVYKNENKLIYEGNISFGAGVVEIEKGIRENDILENCQKALKQAQLNGKNQTVIVR